MLIVVIDVAVKERDFLQSVQVFLFKGRKPGPCCLQPVSEICLSSLKISLSWGLKCLLHIQAVVQGLVP